MAEALNDLAGALARAGRLDEAAAPLEEAQKIQQDMQALLRWFGVKGDNNGPADKDGKPTHRTALEVWRAMSIDEKRESHEKFARGFEAYLFEGKSPNLEMQGLFARFRAWMVNVYQQLRNLNVELSGEVRGVMDRMLASDAQIREAEGLRGMGVSSRDRGRSLHCNCTHESCTGKVHPPGKEQENG